MGLNFLKGLWEIIAFSFMIFFIGITGVTLTPIVESGRRVVFFKPPIPFFYDLSIIIIFMFLIFKILGVLFKEELE